MTIGGNLTLQSGAKLKFNSTDADIAPTFALASGKTLTVNGTAAVEFAEGSAFAPGRKYTLLSGGNLSDSSKFALPAGDRGSLSVEDGNLVYTAPKYFHIIVR